MKWIPLNLTCLMMARGRSRSGRRKYPRTNAKSSHTYVVSRGGIRM